MDPTPPQGEHVETTVDVGVAVEQRCGAVPLGKYRGIPRPALHPDVVDLDTEIGLDAGRGAQTSGARLLCRGAHHQARAPETR